MLRNGEQLLLAIVIPVIVLVGGVLGAERLGLDLDGHRAVDVLAPGVLALAVMSTAFTSIAIATGFERRYGVIKRLGASPLPRSGLLLGKVLALLNVVALQLVVLVVGRAAARLATARHPPTSIGAAVLAVAPAPAAFAALGLFVAGVLRAEATLALANLVYLLLMAGGGVVLPDLALRRRVGRHRLAAVRRARRRDARRPRRRARRRPLAARPGSPGPSSARCSRARTFRWE